MNELYLICDDTPVNNTILRRMLERANPNCLVMEAEKGMDCIELYIEMVQSNYYPKAIFLDQRMPKMTGVEVARVLRSADSNMPVRHYDGPLFLVTAEPNVEEFEKTGLFTGVYEKPLTKDIINEMTGKE